jgi:hypothetical protein
VNKVARNAFGIALLALVLWFIWNDKRLLYSFEARLLLGVPFLLACAGTYLWMRFSKRKENRRYSITFDDAAERAAPHFFWAIMFVPAAFLATYG